MKARVALSLIITSLLVPFLLTGCGRAGNSGEDENMSPQVKIPDIDARVPAKLETATFALG